MPRSTDVKSVLLNVLDCAFDRRSWHGANLISALRGVHAPLAVKRVAGRKCIWEQLLHAAYWKHVVARRLDPANASSPHPTRNWTKVPDNPSEKSWRADVEVLRDIQNRLRKAVIALPSHKLTAKTIWLIHGAAAHDLYHAGQIKLLRRMLKSSA
jgi:hypothetical protein